MGSGQQAWLHLPAGITQTEATERGWIVTPAASFNGSGYLVLCQQVTYYGGPKTGIYWEPVQLIDLPDADLP